jgi:hypothetical protein
LCELRHRPAAATVEIPYLATRLQSQAELVSHSGGNTLLQGTQVRAGAGYAINAGVGEGARTDARIILEGVKTTVQQSRTAKSDYVVWQSMSGSGSTMQTMALPSFAVNATVSYMDDKTGRVVSAQWNSLSPATRDALIGAGKITSGEDLEQTLMRYVALYNHQLVVPEKPLKPA